MVKSRSVGKGRRSVSPKARNARSASASARSAQGSKRASRNSRSPKGRSGGARDDAIALLKADHRKVERMFGEFERSRSDERKRELAERICADLRTHTTIEEEIFYPAFLEATADTDLHHEAEIEHAGAKHLIGEIESTGPEDDHFEARVTVLQEMIKHHVKEEEQRGGMFAKAQSSDMDLNALGQRMKERKLELVGESAEGLGEPLPTQAKRGGRDLRARWS